MLYVTLIFDSLAFLRENKGWNYLTSLNTSPKQVRKHLLHTNTMREAVKNIFRELLTQILHPYPELLT